jgi:hypothetical protein
MASKKQLIITTGGKGISPTPPTPVLTLYLIPPLTERLPTTVSLYVPIFAPDPVITYMLSSMPSQAARLAYLPDYFSTLLKAAALNGGSFDVIEDPSGEYEACAVLIPPGKRVDNTWTLLPAGFVGCLWKLGLGGCRVSRSILLSCISSSCFFRRVVYLVSFFPSLSYCQGDQELANGQDLTLFAP